MQNWMKFFVALVVIAFALSIFGCVGQGAPTVYVCSDGQQVANASMCIAEKNGAENAANRPPNERQPPGERKNQTRQAQSPSPESASKCLSGTKGEPECKDCCDCIEGGANERKTCRDSCMSNDFSKNSNFIETNAPSKLGKDGDYSKATSTKNAQACKEYCDGSSDLLCGDRRYCRDACNLLEGNGTKPQDGNKMPPNAGNATKPAQGGNSPPPQGQGNPQAPPQGNGSGNAQAGQQSQYNIEQAISDKAQLNTLAFGGLGFLTGNLCSDSFLPPGKVSDFFGFQYLRDTTQAGKGHSTDFVTNAANNVLYTLNSAQKAKMIALAKTQAPLVNKFATSRYPLMLAFRRQLEGDIPSGTSGLSVDAVKAYSADLYAQDATISIQRAKLFSDIINSLDSTQIAYLDKMKAGGFASWPSLPDQVDKTTLSHDEHVLVMTYASEMFGWYAGDVEADTYFCPERQGDYFGGFYIKDAPAIGNAGYTIDESITGDAGESFIATLDSSQRPIITSLVDTQRSAINGIVEKRRAISTELRNSLDGNSIDEAKVLELSRQYGELDGEISYYYATAFSSVGKTLTAEQKAKMVEIKNLDGYTCDEGKIYLYSEKIDRPVIENTDFLFK